VPRTFIVRNLARLASATFAIAKKRWLTTILLLWIAYRELIGGSGGGGGGAHKYSYKYDPVMQRNVATKGGRVALTPGCRIGYMEHTGVIKNYVLTCIKIKW
jgi:hypothetical protein